MTHALPSAIVEALETPTMEKTMNDDLRADFSALYIDVSAKMSIMEFLAEQLWALELIRDRGGAADAEAWKEQMDKRATQFFSDVEIDLSDEVIHEIMAKALVFERRFSEKVVAHVRSHFDSGN